MMTTTTLPHIKIWAVGLLVLSAAILGCDDETTGTGAGGASTGGGTTTGGGGGSGGTGATGGGGSGGTGATGGGGSGGTGATGGGGSGGGSGGNGGSGGSGGSIITGDCVVGGVGTGTAATAACVVGTSHVDLQAALDDNACASVGLPADNYYGDFSVSRNVVLVGDGRDATALVGSGATTVLTIGGSANVELRDLEITGGDAANGGGISVASGATLTLTRSDICGNHATSAGAGVYAEGTLALVDTAVRNNELDGVLLRGGGIAVHLGTLSADATSVIADNTVTGELARGGGISLDGSNASLVGTTVSGNHALANSGQAVAFGGGIDCTCAGTGCEAVPFSQTGSLSLSANAAVTGNHAESSLPAGTGGRTAGGGIASLACTLTLDGASVTGNQITADATADASLNGGGLVILRSQFSIEHAHVDNNQLTSVGTPGTTALLYAGGAGLFISDSSGSAGPGLIDHTTVDGNSATAPADVPMFGGGIYILSSDIATDVRIVRSSITNNTLSDGDSGGMFTAAESLSVIAPYHVELVHSTISGNDPGGILASTKTIDSLLTLRNTTIPANLGMSLAPGIYVGPFLNVDIANSIVVVVLCTTSKSVSSGYNIFAGLISGCLGVGSDTIGAFPALSPLANNGGTTLTHALPAGHPAVNAGDPAGCKDSDDITLLSTDQIDQPRVGACDAGAFERQ